MKPLHQFNTTYAVYSMMYAFKNVARKFSNFNQTRPALNYKKKQGARCRYKMTLTTLNMKGWKIY